MKNESITTIKELGIYLLDIILFPIGLYYFFKNFKSPDKVRVRIAYVSLILTFITLFFTIKLAKDFTRKFEDTYNNSPEIQVYRDLLE